MASSRWKRFAFFDRQTLSIPSAVVEDLTVVQSDAVTSSGRFRSTGRDVDNNAASPNVSMVVTTASLPKETKVNTQQSTTQQADEQDQAIAAMWGSLTACTVPNEQVSSSKSNQMLLPSQQQQQTILPTDAASSTTTATTTTDGLVLLFVASAESALVHCFDLTVRCQGPTSEPDLDGWRGYYRPFGTSSGAGATTASTAATTTRTASISALATCRVQEHLHVASLAPCNLVLHTNPHLHLNCRLPLNKASSSGSGGASTVISLASPWKESSHGKAQVMDMIPGLIAVGTETGVVMVYTYDVSAPASLNLVMTIPAPRSSSSANTSTTSSSITQVTSVKWSSPQAVFVGYGYTSSTTTSGGGSGICCFELPANLPTTATGKSSSAVPLARHDLDGRHVASSALCDAILATATDTDSDTRHYMVARPDGLYTYSKTQKIHVSSIDGTKHCMCAIPSQYALVASTDVKSGRDAVDVYDSTHKLVAFHVLLSPGHTALRAVGMTTKPASKRRQRQQGSGGRSSAIVLTSGGSIVTLTEKDTSEKVSLLVQKNLYSAAIAIAYADPAFQPADITALYRRHAEHLYRKGDYSAAMDQYIFTIGSLESSHVIFRYLDAPKIPLLARYLEELRSRDLATPVHNELLRTCYLKLNDNEAAEKIAAFASSAAHASSTSSSATSLVSSLAHTPKEALATVCSLEAPQAAEALVVHGAALARAFPRETAGLVMSLCVGTYSPHILKELTAPTGEQQATKLLERVVDGGGDPMAAYPVHLFAPAFVEHPKMLRLILAHCNRNKCHLTPSLRRTLLELTLEEWNQAKRNGDTEAEKLRRKEAIAALTDAHCRDIGDYDALVIVQLAGFAEGELLLYERMQMTPMLLARYAQDGGDRARRHMLGMCRSDPEILADVLGHFVAIASEKIRHDGAADDASTRSEEEDILDDIREALALAKSQGALPPVRIARILAGEGAGQFSVETNRNESQKQQTVPLSVALDYVGAILDDSRKEISRLKAEVEEYNQLCNSMESEVNSLLSASTPSAAPAEEMEGAKASPSARISIDDLYTKMRTAVEEGDVVENRSVQAREAFWREMNQSEDRFETIARFYAKGVIQ